MDQKKTLWIIAAVGAFLLVVLGAALFFYLPNKKADAVASKAPVSVEQTTVQPSANSNYSGWTTPDVNAGDQVQISANNPATDIQEMVIFSENTSVYDMSGNSSAPVEEPKPTSTTIDLNALKQSQILEAYAQNASQNIQPPAPKEPQNINVTVNLPETSVTINESEQKVVTNDYYISTATETNVKNPVKVETVKPVVKPQESKVTAPVTAPAVKSSNSSSVTSSSTGATVKTTTTTTTTKSTTVTTAQKPVTRYWIQVAAFSNKKLAEQARTALDSNRILADVFTYEDGKGKLYYRVRVGPYTTKSEAEYWQSKILQIKDFAKSGSYITTTSN